MLYFAPSFNFWRLWNKEYNKTWPEHKVHRYLCTRPIFITKIILSEQHTAGNLGVVALLHHGSWSCSSDSMIRWPILYLLLYVNKVINYLQFTIRIFWSSYPQIVSFRKYSPLIQVSANPKKPNVKSWPLPGCNCPNICKQIRKIVCYYALFSLHLI